MSENQAAMQAIDAAIIWSVDQWAQAVGKAIDTVKPPTPPGGGDNSNATGFYAGAAAAGNMIWAATCLLAPEFATPIRLLSFGGAGLASAAGILAAVPPVKPPPGPTAPFITAMKAAVERAKAEFLNESQISKVRKHLYRHIEHHHHGWIAEYGSHEGDIRRAVWEYLFRSPYGDKTAGYGMEYASSTLRRNLEVSLRDFYALVQAQFEAYQLTVKAAARQKYPFERDRYRNGLPVMGLPPSRGAFADELGRFQYVSHENTPAHFNQWLNRNSDFIHKLRTFKTQHLIQ